MDYRNRIVDNILNLKLDAFGATLIVGPKGCGKTTTARQKAKSIIEFQDEDKRDKYLTVANEMPSKLLIGENPRLFDEWQDAPKIWGAIRKSVDDRNETGLYILTGSSSQDVDTPHTGTARISTLKMYPMSLYESSESNGTISLMDLFNKKELEFAEYLSSIGKPMWIRQVLVPGITDDEQDLLALKDFISTLKTVEKVEILPYHDLGKFKWEKLGCKYELEGYRTANSEDVKRAKEILKI